MYTALLAIITAPLAALPPPAKGENLPETGKFESAISCSACHTQPLGAWIRSLDLVLLTEYAIWATHDKHAQAQVILVGERGKRIAARLCQDVLNPRTGCLGCHALNFPEARWEASFKLQNMEGVTCGVCHGPSRNQDGRGGWHDEHSVQSWRKLTGEQKEKKGMRDLRDPEKRATLCTSCHIGNAAEGKVLTHAMFAAGHPPLPPIEVAAFSRNAPQHWRDARDVPFFKDQPSPSVKQNYHLESMDFQRTRQALVGSVVALRETMRLVQSRSVAQTDDPARVWPELLRSRDGTLVDKPPKQLPADRWPELAMAHLDCYACHHDLAVPSSRQQRGYGYRVPGATPIALTPGRPAIRAWPLTALDLSVEATGKCKLLFPDLAKALRSLADATNARPFGDPAPLHAAAGKVVAWCDEVLDALRTTQYDEARVLAWLHALGKLDGLRHADYETARQTGWLFQELYLEWHLKAGSASKQPALERRIEDLGRYLNLQPYMHRAQRLKLMVNVVRGVPGRKVRFTEEDVVTFTKYIARIGDPTSENAMMDNDFLTALVRIQPKEIAEGMQKAQVLKQLQEYSDEELAHALRTVADYRADRFWQKLTALCAQLPAAPPQR